ncbi:MAG: CvpA family protein [Calditrichaeota bacterium]|nr:CvpA family protein [Calditrichota bacterium]MCB0296074.1 CvpA family protein [Calditrichota bacterium]MCB0313731.1 CvpA family protein [Calditrichota bacterium]
MSSLDIIIGLLLAGFILNGLRRGFFAEVLGLIGVLGGTLAGIWGAATLGNTVASILPDFSAKLVLAYLLCFTGLFVGFFYFTRMIARFMKELFENLFIGWLNNFAGGIAGGLKGALALSLILTYAGFMPIKDYIKSSRKDSFLYKPISRVFPELYELLGSPDELPEPIQKLLDESKEKVIDDAIDDYR